MAKPLIEFDYFGVNIFNATAAIGVLFGLLTFLKASKAAQTDLKTETKVLTVLMLSAILGLAMANITNWFFMREMFSIPLIKRFKTAGMNFYGGVLSFFFFSFLFLKLFKLDVVKWINIFVPTIVIFHAFGRIGCSLAGCCYGIELFDKPLIPGTNLHLFPARELEAISLFILAYIFRKKEIKNKFGVYVIYYPVIRFILEFFRGDNRGNLFIIWLSPAHCDVNKMLPEMVAFFLYI